MLDLGPVTLSTIELYAFVLWFIVGALCTVLPGHRAIGLVVGLVLVLQLSELVLFVNPPGAPGVSRFQWFRFGMDLDLLTDTVIVPLLGGVGGALLGERFLPLEE